MKPRTEQGDVPIFSTVVEMTSSMAVHIYNTSEAVNAILDGKEPGSELRSRCSNGRILIEYQGKPVPQLGSKSVLATIAANVMD